jgi:hypothetical protein
MPQIATAELVIKEGTLQIKRFGRYSWAIASQLAMTTNTKTLK